MRLVRNKAQSKFFGNMTMMLVLLGALALLELYYSPISSNSKDKDDRNEKQYQTITIATTTNTNAVNMSLSRVTQTQDVEVSEINDKGRGSTVQSRSSSSSSNPPLAIVTAFSKNHMLEEIAMLRTLVSVNFQGPVYIFLMKIVGENTDWIAECREELSKSPLQLHMIDFEVELSTLNAGTYCFKPTAVGMFLRRNSLLPPNESAQVVMWADASTRFFQNPTIWAKNMIRDGVDFAGRSTAWNIPQQTHIGTFDYFGLKPEDFIQHPSIASGHFLVNLQREAIQKEVLDRWVECGVLDCHTCMAPIGSSKRDDSSKGAEYKYGATEYRAHRQDQAVLTLLVTDYMKKRADANVNIVNPDPLQGGSTTPYFCLTTERGRGKSIMSLKDWNSTWDIPPSACTKYGKVLKITNSSVVKWEDFAMG